MGYTKHLLPTLDLQVLYQSAFRAVQTSSLVLSHAKLYTVLLPLFASSLLRRLYADCVVILSH